jgi:hypothetical protein
VLQDGYRLLACVVNAWDVQEELQVGACAKKIGWELGLLALQTTVEILLDRFYR